MAAEECWTRDIVETYGSWTMPKFRSISARYKKKPYSSLVERLRADFKVQETTDLNDDVAVMLAVSGADGIDGLLLSLVGSYAAATKDGILLEVVDDNRIGLLLERHGIHFMPRSILLRELEFGKEKKNFYEIMFSADGADRQISD